MNKKLVQNLTNQFFSLNEDEKKEFIESLQEWAKGESFSQLGLMAFSRDYSVEDDVYDNFPEDKLTKK